MKLPEKYQKAMHEDAGLSDEERAEKRKRDFTPLPEGTYLFECVGTQDIEADGNREYDQVRIDWIVVEPEEGPNGEDFTKRKLIEWVSMSDNSSWKMRQIFDAAGFEYESNTDELAGDEAKGEEPAQVIGVVTHYTPTRGNNKGKPQHQISEYFPPDADVEIGFDAA